MNGMFGIRYLKLVAFGGRRSRRINAPRAKFPAQKGFVV